MDGRAALGKAAAGGARRLGIDGGDVMALADDLGEGRDGEGRGAEEDDAERHQARGIAPGRAEQQEPAAARASAQR